MGTPVAVRLPSSLKVLKNKMTTWTIRPVASVLILTAPELCRVRRVSRLQVLRCASASLAAHHASLSPKADKWYAVSVFMVLYRGHARSFPVFPRPPFVAMMGSRCTALAYAQRGARKKVSDRCNLPSLCKS